MKSDGKFKLIKRRYNTDDITRTVIECYNAYRGQTKELAETLRVATEWESCRNVWQYAVDHLTYKEDGTEFQHVKTPARLFDDGYGDCKSIAVFCASCLTNMGIPCRFRFVNFNKSDGKDVKHVYVVTESGINVDPVEWFQNNLPFGEVTNFFYKRDMKIDKHGLAILSGVGSAEPYRVWMNGTSFLTNTQAETYIYSALDAQFTLLDINPNDVEAMNMCTRLSCALVLYRETFTNKELLRRASHILQYMDDKSYFSSTSTDDTVRADNLETITGVALDCLASDGVMDAEGPWQLWFQSEIADKNYNNISTDFQEQYDRWLEKETPSVGSTDKNALLNKMKETAPYFTYIFLSDTFYKKYSKKYPQIRIKMQYEMNVYNAWVSGFREEFSESTIKNVLYSGACARLGTTPEKWVEGNLKNGKIGIAIATIAAIVSIAVGVISLISGIVGLCKSLGANKTQKQQDLLNKAITDTPEGTMSEDDFENSIFNNNTETQSNAGGGNILLLLLGGGLLASILSKKKGGKE